MTPSEQYDMMFDDDGGNEMVMRLLKQDGPYSHYERAEFPQKETYLWESLDVHRIVERICGLEPGDIEEDVATMIYDNLDHDKVHRFVDEWFAEQDPDEYDAWWHERNDWLEDK